MAEFPFQQHATSDTFELYPIESQVQPIYRLRHSGCVRSKLTLHRLKRLLEDSGNPTHGSGWIVQVQPTMKSVDLLPRIPPTAVGGSFKSSLQREPTAALCLFVSLHLAARDEKETKNESSGALCLG